MYRVTTGMLKDTMLYNLQTSQRRLDRVQNQVSTGKKASMPHQDPSGVINSMLYKTRITELNQFQKNVDDSESRLKHYDTAMQRVSAVLLELKELGVQAANGIYNDHDRKIASRKVDQLLHELIEIGNTRYKGETIFSGHKINEVPFKAVKQKIPGYDGGALINKVHYQGDIGTHLREVEQLQYVGINQVGNRAFWGDNMRVASSTPGTTYRAVQDQVFRIDGVEIQVKAGDTLPVIVRKINDSQLPVHASIDNTRGSNLLVIESTDPHQLWIEDIRGGSVMQDLGILARGANIPPRNFSATANVHGNSLFDQVIAFRNALIRNELDDIGSKHLGNLDQAIKNTTKSLGEIGALSARLDAVKKRLYTDEVNMKDILSKTEDVDFAEAVTNLKMLEYVKKAAMQVGARVIPPTLLDFLR